jgi:hypothetical protein
MKKDIKSDGKYKVKVQVVPNYGLVYLPDRGVQKQLDDLNEMKRMNHIILKQGEKAV